MKEKLGALQKLRTPYQKGSYFWVVVEQARKAALDTEYTIEATGSVDADYGTVDVSPLVDGDSFELSYNAL